MRLAAALSRRLRGPYFALGRIDARLHHVLAELADQRVRTDSIQAQLTAVRAQLDVIEEAAGLSSTVLRALAADESSNRRSLHALHEEPDYELAWTEPSPLVTVVIPTRDRTVLLTTRALPSVLAQTHSELEVLVVGDGEGPQTARALSELGDPRVRYRNLSLNVRASEDEARAYLVASTMARNAAGPSIRGRWLVHFDDDDAMRPECLSTLLALARETHAEAVYGRARVYLADGDHDDIGDWPPRYGRFTWASGMHHAGLRFLEREFVAAAFGMPGDWWLAERMLRSGVRFAQCEALLADVYPSWTR